LRKLTKQASPGVYLKMLGRAREFSANVFGEDSDEMQSYLESCNAFETGEDKILQINTR
jgi:hypothetical protein